MTDYASRTGSTNTKGIEEPYTDQDAVGSLKQAYSRPQREPLKVVSISPRGAATGVDLLAQTFSDYRNGERLIAVHGDDLRYCHYFRQWLVWDGQRWALDNGSTPAHSPTR